jgi:hypothetical protein
MEGWRALTGVEVAVGFLIAWVARKAGRVGKRADAIVDDALQIGLDRVHEVVIGKLGGDPALRRLEIEAAEPGEVTDRTRTRVQLALEDAVEQDPGFADLLQAAIDQAVRANGGVSSSVNSASPRGIAVGGDNSGIASSGDNAVNIQRR